MRRISARLTFTRCEASSGFATRSRPKVLTPMSIGHAHANRTRMQQRDPAYRRAELTRLQTIAADPAQAREYLLRTSMIAGLRRAAS